MPAESGLTTQTSVSNNDFVRIVTSAGASRKVLKKNAFPSAIPVNTVADLKLEDKLSDFEKRDLLGYNEAGDGGGGIVYAMNYQVKAAESKATGTGITLACDALPEAIKSGKVIEFTGGGLFELTADASKSDTSITGDLTVNPIADNEEGGLQANDGTVIEIDTGGAFRFKRVSNEFIYAKQFGVKSNGDDSYTELLNAVNVAKSEDKKLIFTEGRYYSSSSIDFTEIVVKFEKGAILKVLSTDGVLMDFAKVEAGVYQIFDVDNIISRRNPLAVRSSTTYPEWFGAVGDRVADDIEPLEQSWWFGTDVFYTDAYRISRTANMKAFSTHKAYFRRQHNIIIDGSLGFNFVDYYWSGTDTYPSTTDNGGTLIQDAVVVSNPNSAHISFQNVTIRVENINNPACYIYKAQLNELNEMNLFSISVEDSTIGGYMDITGGPYHINIPNLGFTGSGCITKEHPIKVEALRPSVITAINLRSPNTEKGILLKGPITLKGGLVEHAPDPALYSKDDDGYSVIMVPKRAGSPVIDGTMFHTEHVGTRFCLVNYLSDEKQFSNFALKQVTITKHPAQPDGRWEEIISYRTSAGVYRDITSSELKWDSGKAPNTFNIVKVTPHEFTISQKGFNTTIGSQKTGGFAEDSVSDFDVILPLGMKNIVDSDRVTMDVLLRISGRNITNGSAFLAGGMWRISIASPVNGDLRSNVSVISEDLDSNGNVPNFTPSVVNNGDGTYSINVVNNGNCRNITWSAEFLSDRIIELL